MTYSIIIDRNRSKRTTKSNAYRSHYYMLGCYYSCFLAWLGNNHLEESAVLAVNRMDC